LAHPNSLYQCCAGRNSNFKLISNSFQNRGLTNISTRKVSILRFRFIDLSVCVNVTCCGGVPHLARLLSLSSRHNARAVSYSFDRSIKSNGAHESKGSTGTMAFAFDEPHHLRTIGSDRNNHCQAESAVRVYVHFIPSPFGRAFGIGWHTNEPSSSQKPIPQIPSLQCRTLVFGTIHALWTKRPKDDDDDSYTLLAGKSCIGRSVPGTMMTTCIPR
jgi:hypothetical protein